jgi:hypothetical protein
MKNLLSSLCFIACFSTYSSAQGFIYVGDNKYNSTETWSFKINGVAWGEGNLEVKIAKNGLSGILMLQTPVPSESCYIGGDVFIYLSDGTRITCKDKNIIDHVDNKAVAIYYLTNDEINQLSKLHISSIRFTIHPTESGGFNGSKTADNNIGYSNSYIETNKVIRKLFE